MTELDDTNTLGLMIEYLSGLAESDGVLTTAEAYALAALPAIKRLVEPDPDPVLFQCSMCDAVFSNLDLAYRHQTPFGEESGEEPHGGFDLFRKSEIPKPDSDPVYTGQGWPWSTASGYADVEPPKSITGTVKETDR